MSDPVISVKGVSKRYRLGIRDKADTVAERLQNILLYPIRNYRRITSLNKFNGEDDQSIFWALRDINFEVKEGEVLGIIGRNGAGKSTLLKILSRITEPTTGEIWIRGRVSSLLEVGTGFHPELTGRDNVYMNGTILGMSKREVDQKFDEIVEFSGVEKYIDTPVKFYSSGMTVRLAFAVAAHLEPEILIVDEVLAVGDLAFQKKCLGKMEDVSQAGRTVLFVSHNMGAVEGLCSRVLTIDGGRITRDGNTSEVIHQYRREILDINQSALSSRTDRSGTGNIQFKNVTINQDSPVISGGPLRMEISYVSKKSIPDIHLSIVICNNYDERILVIDSRNQGVTLQSHKGEGVFVISLAAINLLASTYTINLWCGEGSLVSDYIVNAARLDISDKANVDSGNTLHAHKHGFLLPPAVEWNVMQANGD